MQSEICSAAVVVACTTVHLIVTHRKQRLFAWIHFGKNSLWVRGLQPPIWDLQSRVRSDSDGLWRVAVALAPRPGHGDRGRPVGYAALRLQALTAASADGCMLDQLQSSCGFLVCHPLIATDHRETATRARAVSLNVDRVALGREGLRSQLPC